MTAVVIVLVIATILIALASRRWRRNAIPWATVVFYAAAVYGASMLIIVAAAVISLSIESWKKPKCLVESLLPMAIATMAAAPSFLGLPQSFLRLTAMYAGTLLILPLAHMGAARTSSRRIGIWAELAAAMLLLTAAVLITTGLALRLPLLCILGLAAPMTFPAFFQEDLRNRDRSTRLEDMGQILGIVASPEGDGPSCTLEGIASKLHRFLEPVFAHELTVVAVNPAFSTPACTVEMAPPRPDQLPRIQERSRYLFLSGRANKLTAPGVLVDHDTLRLVPGFHHQVLIPVWKNHHVYALVAFLGHRPFVSEAELPSLSTAIVSLMIRAIDVTDDRQKLEFLEKQAEQQGRRLRHLLELNQLVSASPDLHDLAQNLVRAVSIAFGFTWVGFMLRDQRRREVRLLSWAGEASVWKWPDDVSPVIGMDTLDQALDMSSTVASFNVVPMDRWPYPLPQAPGVQHLLAVSLRHLDRVLGYLAILPHPVQPMPDPEDLRALEILVEQIVPFVLSGLQIELINRKTLIDPLTGIANRRSLDSFIRRAVENSEESGEAVSFAMLDVDDFKLINDRFGHAVGDQVLKEIAAILTKNIRTKDFVARYGGEEFFIVLPGLPSHRAMEVLDRIRISLAQTPLAVGLAEPAPAVTVSIGVASYPEHGSTVEVLMETADMALYRAKRSGKNRVVGARETGPEDVFGQELPTVLGPA